jgi:glutamate-ammonia-ligase adenylyltransferase
MQSRYLADAVEACADPQRTRDALERLQETGAASTLKKLGAEEARILAALLSGSQTSAEIFLTHPDWLPLILQAEELKHPRRAQGMSREIEPAIDEALKLDGYEAGFARLREFKQRQMLRIAARDLAHLARPLEIVAEISDVADICIDAVCRLCLQQLIRKTGRPYHLNAAGRWEETQFCVLGLGKLGGQELNYSSDIDVIYIYSEEGNVFKTKPRPGEQSGKGLANHQFFARLAEAITAEISRRTPQGMLYRVDLRLRPEGKTGPLARSLASYENFYAQWGQTWERMMLIKGRPVGGSIELGSEFLEMVQSFRYPRSIGSRTLREISTVKKRLENEIVREGELDRNVKLGRGGIREIEFIAQTLQVLNAGRNPFLQGAATVPTLRKLVSYGLLPGEDAETLEQAYFFLRDVEHRLQMDADHQTHTIPTERRARERLARLMDFKTLRDFEAARRKHCDAVRAIYEKVVGADEPEQPQTLPDQFENAEDRWTQLLAAHGFRDPAAALRMVRMFIEGPDYVHVSDRTVELARELFPKFLALCPLSPKDLPKGARFPTKAADTKRRQSSNSPAAPAVPAVSQPQRTLSDPDRVMVRLDSYVEAYGARATLYELWTHNPSLFELLLWLFDRSEFLAQKAVSAPDLIDDLERSGRLRRQKSAEQTLEDLRHGAADEDQFLWLRRYHETELMRIGLRDILDLADREQNLLEMSALAEACLQYALEVVMRRRRMKAAPFCIIGMGKLGGREIGYGSDLDIIFVTDAPPDKLPPLQRMAAEIMDLLSSQTAAGTVFRTDARLRPDGEKGLLVNTLIAHEEYYRKRAGLWEIQALTRARPVAGDPETGKRFMELAATLANFTPANVQAGFLCPTVSRPRDWQRNLAAFTPDWRNQIAAMRKRILTERTAAGQDELAIKTGKGGLIDVEFLAQMFCLAGGWHEPNTLSATLRANQSGALPPEQGKTLVENYRKLRRIEGILRRWSFEGETALPDDPAALLRVAIRCGFPGSDEFMREVRAIRAAIADVFDSVFGRE